MYRKLIKTILIVLAVVLTAFPLSAAFADVSGNADEIDTAYSSTRDMLTALAEKAGWSEDCNWIVLGLARSGELTEEMGRAYSTNVADVLVKNESATMDTKQSTNNARAVLALTAAGYDVTDVAGYDLLEPLSNIGYVRAQGMNGPIWALHAFDCGAYEIPECENQKMQTTRENLVSSILGSQRSDHGWAFSGSSSDVDMTCMALQALAPYYSGDGEGAAEVSEETLARVRTAVDEAVLWLISAQNEDGSFSSGSYVNSESASQVIVALTGMGIDPADNDILLKDGKGAVDALMSFYVEGGGFKHISSNYKANGLASMQGYYALAALYRYRQGMTSLYDMTDTEIIYKAEADIEPADSDDPEDDPSDDPTDDPGDDPSDDPSDDPTDDKSGDKDKGDDSGKTPSKADKSSSKAGSKIELDKKDKKTKEKEISAIETLLKKAEEAADALPAEAEKYSEEDLTLVTDIWKEYLELSPAEQLAMESDERWQKYLDCTKALAGVYHRDDSAGADLTMNGEEQIPWYVKLVVSEYSASDIENEAASAALGEGGVLYGFHDLYFINTLDGSVWTPDDIITVRLKMPEGFIGTPVAVHLSSDGTVELLDASAIRGDDGVSYAEFCAAEFSPYGLAGIDGSLDELLIGDVDDEAIAEEDDSAVMPWIAACGGGALALLILAFIRKKAFASEDGTASDADK